MHSGCRIDGRYASFSGPSGRKTSNVADGARR